MSIVDEEDFEVIEFEDIDLKSKDSVINLALDTISKNKQMLIFNSSKSSSEATAEKIANSIPVSDDEVLNKISEKILKSFSNPTKQCLRLAKCVKKGVAFHHSGLVAKQRNLIEEAFKRGHIKIISSTPTLAAGLNLPAYIALIKDYRRFSSNGYSDIPVLEFFQMAGRAGRPGHEDFGRAILRISSSSDDSEKKRVVKKYILGRPEDIYSKLAVEPTLKMYLLSLISMDIINTSSEIKKFFENTLYGKQYDDLEGLHFNIFKILDVLKHYGFIIEDDDYFKATLLGRKVSQIYLNPDSAHQILKNFERIEDLFKSKNMSRNNEFVFFQFISSLIEMKPLFRVKKKEEEFFVKKLEEFQEDFIEEYDPFEIDFEEVLNSLKTAEVLMDWVYEAPESYILEKYGTSPGELQYKLSRIDWLLYCFEEFATLKKKFFMKTSLTKLRGRFKSGVKEELLDLVSLKGVGRVRARKLFDAGIKKIDDIASLPLDKISSIVGEKVAISLKNQVGDLESSNSKLDFGKPKEIKVREVSDEEVNDLIFNEELFLKEKKKVEEKQRSLKSFF